jgi:hypothetical protein
MYLANNESLNQDTQKCTGHRCGNKSKPEIVGPLHHLIADKGAHHVDGDMRKVEYVHEAQYQG